MGKQVRTTLLRRGHIVVHGPVMFVGRVEEVNLRLEDWVSTTKRSVTEVMEDNDRPRLDHSGSTYQIAHTGEVSRRHYLSRTPNR